MSYAMSININTIEVNYLVVLVGFCKGKHEETEELYWCQTDRL